MTRLQQLDDFADAFRRGGRHGDDDFSQFQPATLLQNFFRRANHWHAVNARTPLMFIIIKEDYGKEAQASLGEKVIHQVGADVSRAHNPNPSSQGVLKTVGRQVALAQYAKSQPGASQAQARDQEVAQDDSARRRISAPGNKPERQDNGES